ncbi:MAG: DUF427 domain-containing protein [Pseudomonadales bacterium]
MNQITVPTLPVSDAIRASREQWQYRGEGRPEFAEQPGVEQESVWDYPRPPRIEPVSEVLRVFSGKTEIAQTQRGVRVCETAGAPTYYFPPQDVDFKHISLGEMSSICEWKGVAQSLTVDGIAGAGWRYVRMFEEYIDLYDWPSFHPKHLLCFIDIEQVSHQDGGFYGGWVSSRLSGPIKGRPGTEAW